MLSEQAKSEIRTLQARYPVARSALGPALYVAQREAGWLPPGVLAEVAGLFGLDVAEVGEFASFYHMYNTHREPGQYNIELCDNVPCMLGGAAGLGDLLVERLGIGFGETTPDGKFSLGHIECLGSCATAPMFMCTEKATGRIRYFEELNTPEKLDAVLAAISEGRGFDTCERWPIGPFRHGGRPDTNILLARVDKPDSYRIATYIADGGYEVARGVIMGVGAIPQRSPAQVIDEMKAANVRGRGGAGFSAGMKWGFVPAGKHPRYLVVNADESEPGTFKDRMIMEYDPHQLSRGSSSPLTPSRPSGRSSTCAGSTTLPRSSWQRPWPRLRPRGSWATTSSARVRSSRSWCTGARARMSAAKKPRCSPRWKAIAAIRGSSRPSPRSRASMASRPSSTTSRRSPTCRTCCATARIGTSSGAPPRAPAFASSASAGR